MRPANRTPAPRDTPPPPDRPVFFAVLPLGLVAIIAGRPSAPDLAADLGALATLYGVYRRS